MENIYLIPTDDMTYRAQISKERPICDALLLVEEGTYPTNLYYIRHDLNMCSELRKVLIKNRDELIRVLNSMGNARNGIDELWDYGKTKNPANINRLFNLCYERKAELFYQEIQEICSCKSEE